MTDADLIRAHVEIETEGSKPFYRDQHLTPQALYRAKVLAVLHSTPCGSRDAWETVDEIISRVNEIPL